MPSNFFAYGSLMDPEIMAQVSGNVYPPVPVVLDGYLRRVVEEQVFPALVAKEGSQVKGVLWQGLSESTLIRLDSFEGVLYRRSEVEVTDQTGQRHLAATYVLRGEYLHLFSDQDWDPGIYLSKCRAAFLGEHSG